MNGKPPEDAIRAIMEGIQQERTLRAAKRLLPKLWPLMEPLVEFKVIEMTTPPRRPRIDGVDYVGTFAQGGEIMLGFNPIVSAADAHVTSRMCKVKFGPPDSPSQYEFDLLVSPTILVPEDPDNQVEFTVTDFKASGVNSTSDVARFLPVKPEEQTPPIKPVISGVTYAGEFPDDTPLPGQAATA